MPGEIPAQAFLDKIKELEHGDRGIYLVAEIEGGVVGHLLLEPMPLTANSHICTLTVAFYPSWQGRGFGRQLLNFAIQWASRVAKVEKIELMVRASNEPAIRLYRSMGFLQEGRIRNRVKEPNEVYDVDIAMGLFVEERPAAEPLHAADAPAGHQISMRKFAACLVRG